MKITTNGFSIFTHVMPTIPATIDTTKFIWGNMTLAIIPAQAPEKKRGKKGPPFHPETRTSWEAKIFAKDKTIK